MKKRRPPLERLALHYAGRYATTRSKLRSYLLRKVRERGWEGDAPVEVEGLVERCAGLGYVDDRAFAAQRTSSLQRRGYGKRRVEQALRAAGIAEEDSAEARAQAEEGAWAAAVRFASRKRIGPFSTSAVDPVERQKAFAAMMRAGHAPDHAGRLLAMKPGEVPEMDGA